MIASILLFATVAITPQSEIVLATNAPYATRLAAEELNFFLKGVFGEALPVVAERTPGRSAIVLGCGRDALVALDADGNSFSDAAGTPRPRVANRDGFVIEATNGVVRIFGNDDDVPGGDISKTCWYGKEAPWQPHFRRGTLFGVSRTIRGREKVLSGGTRNGRSPCGTACRPRRSPRKGACVVARTRST